MRYRLRTLLIVLAVGPFVGALVYWQVERAIQARRKKQPEIVVEVVWTTYVQDIKDFLPPESSPSP